MSCLRSFLISTSLSVSLSLLLSLLSLSLHSFSSALRFPLASSSLHFYPKKLLISPSHTLTVSTFTGPQPQPPFNVWFLTPLLLSFPSYLSLYSPSPRLLFSFLLCEFNTFKDRYGCSSNHTGVPSQCQSEGWQSRENWSWILLPTLHRWVREEYTFIPVFSFCLSLVFRSSIESGTSKSFVENHFIFLSIHCVLPFLIILLMPTSENRILVLHIHTHTHTRTRAHTHL